MDVKDCDPALEETTDDLEGMRTLEEEKIDGGACDPTLEETTDDPEGTRTLEDEKMDVGASDSTLEETTDDPKGTWTLGKEEMDVGASDPTLERTQATRVSNWRRSWCACTRVRSSSVPESKGCLLRDSILTEVRRGLLLADRHRDCFCCFC